jgi:hypothetical protein
MVPVPRSHSAMIHIAPALITRTRGLRRQYHHQQWDDTVEKVQHNLLCGHTPRRNLFFFWENRRNLSYSHAISMCLFVVWFNYLRHVRFSRRTSIPLFGTCSHMPHHVLVFRFNYLRHVRFSSGPLYPSLVHVLTCHFMCCACWIM